MRIPAGQKHWHGASPRASMTHIAITEPREGTNVQWMEKVTDEQYSAAPPGSEPHPPSHSRPPRDRPDQFSNESRRDLRG